MRRFATPAGPAGMGTKGVSGFSGRGGLACSGLRCSSRYGGGRRIGEGPASALGQFPLQGAQTLRCPRPRFGPTSPQWGRRVRLWRHRALPKGHCILASSILESGLYPLCAAKRYPACAAKRYPAWEARSQERQPVFGKALPIQVKSELTSRKTRRASPRRASALVRQRIGLPGNFLEHDPEKVPARAPRMRGS